MFEMICQRWELKSYLVPNTPDTYKPKGPPHALGLEALEYPQEINLHWHWMLSVVVTSLRI